MMLLKLEPGVATKLPLTAYYGVTLFKLHVADSGIRNCVLHIAGEQVYFSTGEGDDQAILTVQGNPANTPTFKLLPDMENKVALTVPGDVPVPAGRREIFLEYSLSYSVPR